MNSYHEQILPALGRVRADLRFTDVVISHVGYHDPALVAAKLERNLRLILMEDAEHPDDPFTLFNLGWAYLALGRTQEAVPVLQRSLKVAQPGASIVHKLYALLATAHRQLQQPEAALAACRAGLARTPGDAELIFLEGLLLQERGEFAEAERRFRQLLPDAGGAGGEGRPAPPGPAAPPLGASVFGTPSFGSLEMGLRGHHARFRLAQVLAAQGQGAEAEALWRVILADHPGDVMWSGLQRLAALGRVVPGATALGRVGGGRRAAAGGAGVGAGGGRTPGAGLPGPAGIRGGPAVAGGGRYAGAERGGAVGPSQSGAHPGGR